jgi:PD-(D/E)XK nuclease superfamily protein
MKSMLLSARLWKFCGSLATGFMRSRMRGHWQLSLVCAICPISSRRPSIFSTNVKVGRFTPDLVVLGKIIVDTKVIEKISNHERGQMLNYLKITRLPVGVILNFGHAKLEWERFANTEHGHYEERG